MTGFDASAELFSQAAVLLMIGMAFVFAFLSLLIIFIKVVITPLGNRFPDPVVKDKATNVGNVTNSESSAVVAAISIAITKYRQKHKHPKT